MYGNIIFTVVHVCEYRSLTLRKKHKLWVLEYRVLRQTFQLKEENITRRWRKLYNEFHDIYSSSNVFRGMRSKLMRWPTRRFLASIEENKNT